MVKKIINYWGSGKYQIKSKNTHYEQANLQLNINKAKKILKWTPTLSIDDSIKFTVEWYKSVLVDQDQYEKITEKQIKDFLKIKAL